MFVSAFCVSLSLFSSLAFPLHQNHSKKKPQSPRLVPMDNTTLIPLHDLVIHQKPFEYPISSGKFFVVGHFYLGGHTKNADYLQRNLKWYFLDSAPEIFDPAAEWADISDGKVFQKTLSAKKMPWSDQGTRVDFAIHVPKLVAACSLAVGLAGKNKNPDNPGHREVREASLVITTFPIDPSLLTSDVPSGEPTTNTIVPITLHRRFEGFSPGQNEHHVFLHSAKELQEGSFFVSQSNVKGFPKLGSASGWRKLADNEFKVSWPRPNHTNTITLDSSLGQFVMIVAGDATETPDGRGVEWSVLIRSNKS